MNIILANPTHAEQIAAISRETFYDTFAEYNTQADMDLFMEQQFSMEMLMEEVGMAGRYFLLAVEGNRILGYTQLRDATHESLPDRVKPAMEIARLYVRKPEIGKGVGKLLMEAAIRFAQEASKKSIWLGVWEQNARAIRFYEQFGYQQFGEQKFLLGTDLQHDWLMWREV
jgi:ribosomal protein S18 acetylase RimI-like enzyme